MANQIIIDRDKKIILNVLQNKFYISLIFIVLSLGFLWIPNVKAATIYINSCMQSDVQSAINSASTGDIVTVPAGNCTWSSQITIASKGISVIGAGKNSTKITGRGFTLSGNQTGTRISGFEFDLTGGYALYAPSTGGANVQSGWRIDNCRIKVPEGSYQISAIYGWGSEDKPFTGLVDNNELIQVRNLHYGQPNDIGYYPTGKERYAEPLGMGSSNAIYVENNIITGISPNDYSQMIDTNHGGRYVVRFNTINNMYMEAHSVQGDLRGTRLWEIYKNNIHNDDGYLQYYAIRPRAGTGVIWGNTVTGDWKGRVILFDNVRSYAAKGSGGLCDGSSPWDANQDSTGWPCRDQIGRSTDAWLWTDANPYPPQQSDPAYLWQNTYQGSLYNASVSSNSTQHIKPNRDYYEQQSGSFNGSSGVGVGTLSQRPSTCTTGVGYWATDQGNWNKSGSGGQGVLYKCTSTNKWELYYTPYEYPHPLRKGAIYNPPPESDVLTPPKIKNIEPI